MGKISNEIKTFLYGVLAFCQVDADIARILIILIFFDMILGTLKSCIISSLKFRINTFWLGLIKKSLILIIIMVLALVAKGLGFDDFKAMVSIVIKIMILNEGISILNNTRSIINKKVYKSSDFISLFIEKIEVQLTSYINKLINSFDNNDKCN